MWTIDFKGQFKLGSGAYCYPLTVVDGYSRYLLACQGLPSTAGVGARGVLERLFQANGVPDRIRSDNGAPFATCALGRLSALSVWWLKLGITPELIQPAHPEQNGRHERMHRTLKAEATRPAASSRPVRSPEYPRHFETRYVSTNGGIRWHHRWVNVSHVLVEEYVGLEEVADGVYFGDLLLGRLDERDFRMHGAHNRNRI